MLVLYYFANKLNYLVCGTGNKSEYRLGYFTKFGDGATDILPIGDLLKRQVRKLAMELGIPERIITKPPTAGLWPGQTDEGEMGITYNELDDILERIDKKKAQVQVKVKFKKVKAMMKRSEHKREGPRICYI
jgi:NAD+ synthase